MFAFAGCGKKNNKTEFKIGVLHIGLEGEETGYSAAHENGIKQMIKETGLKDSQVVRKWNISDGDEAKITKTIVDLIENEKCKVIIGTSFGYQKPMAELAAKYKDVIFSHGTGYMHNETNMNNYFGRIYQARYLSGMIAGLKAKEIGNNKLGYVSAYGNSIAETVSGFNAFYLGAKSVNPDVTMDVSTIGSWFDPTKEKSSAEALLNAGAGIVGHHSDTISVCDAANKAGKFSIGYNTDMNKVGKVGDSVLTSVIWHWGVYYTQLIKAVQNNDFKSIGQYYKGYKEGLVDITALSDKAPKDADKYLKLVKDLLKEDKWDVFSGKTLKFKEVDGNITVEQVSEDIKGRSKNGEALRTVIKAGESVADGVIQGSMDYIFEGITGGFDK
jgi:hypothetical protein